jgi:hypothetical protein
MNSTALLLTNATKVLLPLTTGVRCYSEAQTLAGYKRGNLALGQANKPVCAPKILHRAGAVWNVYLLSRLTAITPARWQEDQ